MSAARPYLPRGINNQGRLTPTRLLDREDASGLCDTVPGELDCPEAEFQRDPVGEGLGLCIGAVVMTPEQLRKEGSAAELLILAIALVFACAAPVFIF